MNCILLTSAEKELFSCAFFVFSVKQEQVDRISDKEGGRCYE